MRSHPVEFIDGFIKEAAEQISKPYGVGDAKKTKNRKVPSGPQIYSQPNTQLPTTQPGLTQNQRAVPPPPVM